MRKINRLEESLKLSDFIPWSGVAKYADRCYLAREERGARPLEDWDCDESVKCLKKSMNNGLILSIYNGLLGTAPVAYFLLYNFI